MVRKWLGKDLALKGKVLTFPETKSSTLKRGRGHHSPLIQPTLVSQEWFGRTQWVFVIYSLADAKCDALAGHEVTPLEV